MARRLTDLEQDVIDACHDLNGGPQRTLQRLFSDVPPAELEDVLTRLVEYGLVWRDRGVIGDREGVQEENIWTLTGAGEATVSS